MTPVTSIEQPFLFIERVRSRGQGYLTNFFPDARKLQRWLDFGALLYVEKGNTIFILRKNEGFYNLFFLSAMVGSLGNDVQCLQEAYPDIIFVADIIGIEVSGLRDAFIRSGFGAYTSLVRMSRVVQTDDIPRENAFISPLGILECTRVLQLLQEHFDPYCEQIPLPAEVQDWADKGQILVYSDDRITIQGLLIFEQTGQTGYLRYWFVHPQYREKKIGSALIHAFFNKCRTSKRQLFWVIGTNENAIKRYEHYGFKKEALQDLVLINCDKKYERENN